MRYTNLDTANAGPTPSAARANSSCYDITLVDGSRAGWGDCSYFGGPVRNSGCL